MSSTYGIRYLQSHDATSLSLRQLLAVILDPRQTGIIPGVKVGTAPSTQHALILVSGSKRNVSQLTRRKATELKTHYTHAYSYKIRLVV
jgi:hypothetical protein